MNSIVKKNIHFALIVNTLPDVILKKSCKGSKEMAGRTMQTISKRMSPWWVLLVTNWRAFSNAFAFLLLDAAIHRMHFWRQQLCLLLI
jgi:hypothetical protein